MSNWKSSIGSRFIYRNILIVVCLFSQNALAYIDPGIGGILVQLVVVFLASCLFYSKKIIKFVFRNRKNNKNETEKD